MKIAIPTNDAINIHDLFDSVKGFVVFTMQFGEITDEEYRKPSTNDLQTNGNIAGLLYDCTHLIVSVPDEKALLIQGNDKPKVITTPEKNITKIILNFMNESYRHESNTCCCP